MWFHYLLMIKQMIDFKTFTFTIEKDYYVRAIIVKIPDIFKVQKYFSNSPIFATVICLSYIKFCIKENLEYKIIEKRLSEPSFLKIC